ncbi:MULTISPECIES: methyl-accepting chemotaxis protein [Haloferacaceae]|uniref:Methyl-accepting chemotaxis protein n=1 Tax=Halorubrum glutamatedens TaxID=2707018 RepID=A0ABD5QRN1_9EURY|nr:methyl-accepting chemotaxis protein [Halobellus captivus]
MTGFRGLLRRVLGGDRNSRSLPDGGVVVDGSSDEDLSEADAGIGSEERTNEGRGVTDEDGVDRAETLERAGFEQVFDATSVPTFILDREGSVVEWNESIATLTGVDREDAVGSGHVSELFYPDGRRADTLADKVLDAPEDADEAYGVERPDSARNRYRDSSTMVDRHGDERHIEFTATPLYGDDGELVGVTEVVVDRTENVEGRKATAALISEIRGTAEAIGEGDLEARITREESFERLDDDLLRVVDAVDGMAENLEELSRSVHEQAREIDDTVEEASEAAGEIATNVDEQNELLAEGVAEMQSFSAGMEEVAATADQVDAAASNAREAAEEGLDASSDAREATEDVVDIGDELVDSVGALSDRMDDIEEVIEVISDVAEQTNLLALNANIEAARAGEEGNGFAVVAEEVKKLADETRGHTEAITDSLAELQAQSDETSAAVERSHERIEDAGEEIETVLDSLSEIADAVDEAADGVAEVARTTDDQAATVEELTATLESVRDRSDRTESATERIVDATDDQEAAVAELIARVERLDAAR